LDKPFAEGEAVNETSANPVFVALLFVLRCLVPLAILFGISYILRKLGLVAETPEHPSEEEENGEEPPRSKKNKKES
jgi:hypothetical protein